MDKSTRPRSKKSKQPASSIQRPHSAPGWHSGCRMGVFDLTRVTEQMAVLASMRAGHVVKGETHRKNKHILMPWAIGALAKSFGNLCPLYVDAGRGEKPEQASSLWASTFGSTVAKRSKHRHVGELPEYNLDLIVTPLDGSQSLREGFGSSASVLAGGQESCFPAEEKLASEYFVIVVGPTLADQRGDVLAGIQLPAGVLLEEHIASKKYVDNIITQARKVHGHATIGISRQGFEKWFLPISVPARKVVLGGSTFQGALAALFREDSVDIAAMFCRTPQVIQIAVACKAVGGRMWMIPVMNKERPLVSSSVDGGKPRVLDEIAVVRGDHAFVIATGITSGRVLKGVKFFDANRVVTHTVCLSTRHQSRRQIISEFDLNKVWFVDPHGRPLKGDEALGAVVEGIINTKAHGEVDLKPVVEPTQSDPFADPPAILND